MEGTAYREEDPGFKEIEGIIRVLAIDEVDHVTGKQKGKFVNYLQTDAEESFILEPLNDVSVTPVQPNTKVRVFGIRMGKKIFYQKIIPVRK